MATIEQITPEVRPPAIDEPHLLSLDEITTIRGVARFARAQAEFAVKVPDKVAKPHAALIVNGYGGIGEGYEDLGDQIARRGKVAVVMDPAYSFSPKHHADLRYFKSPEKLPSQTNWAVMKKVREDMDGLGIEKFDLVGHSMGGFVGAETAKLKSEPVRSMTFLASAGQYKQGLGSLAFGGARFIVTESPGIAMNLQPQSARRAGLQFVRYWASLHRRLLEGLAVGNSNVVDTVHELRSNGIITAVVAFEKDSFFDAQKIRETMEPIVDIYEPHHDPEARHGAPQKDPIEVARSLFRVWDKIAKLQET